MILAATAERHQVGNFLGLLIAAALIWAGYTVHQRWIRLRDEGLSPTAPATPPEGVKPQISGPVDPGMTPGGVVAKRGDADLDEFVRQQAGKIRRRDLITAATARFGRSESTIKRAIRRAKGDPT